jgi:hypothetical protein
LAVSVGWHVWTANGPDVGFHPLAGVAPQRYNRQQWDLRPLAANNC